MHLLDHSIKIVLFINKTCLNIYYPVKWCIYRSGWLISGSVAECRRGQIISLLFIVDILFYSVGSNTR